MTTPHILIADDHPLIRSGLHAQLAPLGRFLISEASDAASVRALLVRAHASGQGVELALMDLLMPGMQGAASVIELAQLHPEVAFVVITAMPIAPLVPALRNQPNVRGILDKSHSAGELRRVVDLALAGVPVWPASESIPSEGLDALTTTYLIANKPYSMRASTLFSPEKQVWNELTPRLQSVAHCVARGLSNAEVAAELGLTEGTVKAYLKDIFRILGVSNRTQLALRLQAS